MEIIKFSFCFAVIIIIFTLIYSRITKRDYVNPKVNLKVTSAAFEDGKKIPVKYTGRGKDISPPLKFEEITPEAKTIAIIMDDLDHPLGQYNHWVIWNIPTSFKSICEGIPGEENSTLLGKAVQGKSDYGGKHYYRGPLPPFGSHRYIFKVYVLDIVLDLHMSAGKIKLQKEMQGHILQFGTLEGKFGR